MPTRNSLVQGLPVDDYVACAAFAYFGYRTLKESFEIEEDEKGGELLDAEEALAEVRTEYKWGPPGCTRGSFPPSLTLNTSANTTLNTTLTLILTPGGRGG